MGRVSSESANPLDFLSHRPWPLPRGPWVMRQSWHDLLFAHWPVDADLLRPLLPRGLELDLLGGQAWLGVVPFRMSRIALRGLPALPGLSAFPELNVRTYASLGGKPGVWFLSLDVTNAAAVGAARTFFHLPYFRSRMKLERAQEWIRYEAARIGAAASASFRGRYRPLEAAPREAEGEFTRWLTERYCLYSADRRGRIYRGEIHHRPWPLESAEAEIEAGGMLKPFGLELPAAAPHLRFARDLDVLIWPLAAC